MCMKKEQKFGRGLRFWSMRRALLFVRRGARRRLVSCGLAAALATLPLASVTASEPDVPRTMGHARKKGARAGASDATAAFDPSGALLGTLVQTHTDERVMLDDSAPSAERFAALLADRVTGASHPINPRLIGLVRALAGRHSPPGVAARVELVSGFRSPKLNEMLRKKGHHVASHSQHSLGNALDFRLVVAGESEGIDPRTLEREIRALGWDGGVGIYLTKSDWFVHADVGPLRRWEG